MTAALVGGQTKINPNEEWYNSLKQNDTFNEEDFKYMQGNDQAEEYLALIQQAQNNGLTLNQLEEEYDHYDMMDSQRRTLALANEVNPDAKTTYADRTISEWDAEAKNEDGTVGAYKDVVKNMSDYEYTHYLLDQWSEYQQYQIDQALIQEAEDAAELAKESNVFGNVLGSVGSFFMHLANGAAQYINDTGQFFAATGGAIGATFDGDAETTADDAFREAYEEGYGRIEVFDDFEQWLYNFDRKHTYMAEYDGTPTWAGKYIAGVADSIGNMLPSLLMTAATGGAAAPIAVAGRVVGTGSYYLSMWSSRMQEKFNDPKFDSVPTGAIVGQTAIASALDAAIEMGSAKLFGGTFFEQAMFGGAIRKASSNWLKTMSKDFLTEGLEEAIQEFTEYFTEFSFSFAYEEFTNTDFGLQTMWDAFVMGGLSSAFMTTSRILITRKNFTVDADGKVHKFSKAQSFEQDAQWSNLMQEYQRILKDQSHTDEQMLLALQQLYNASKVFSNMYKKLGEERMTKAMQYLNMFKSMMEIKKFVKSNPDAQGDVDISSAFRTAVEGIMSETSQLKGGKLKQLTPEQRKSAINESKRRKTTSSKTDVTTDTQVKADTETQVDAEPVQNIFDQIKKAGEDAVKKSKKSKKSTTKTDTTQQTSTTQQAAADGTRQRTQITDAKTKATVERLKKRAERLKEKYGFEDADSTTIEYKSVADAKQHVEFLEAQHIVSQTNANTLNRLIELSHKNIVVLGADTSIILENDGTIVVPEHLLDVMSAEQIIKATAEQMSVQTLTTQLPKQFLTQLTDIVTSYINKGTLTTLQNEGFSLAQIAMYYVLFDEKFYDLTLNTSYDVGYKVTLALDRVLQHITDNSAFGKIQQNTINNMILMMRNCLKRYFILHANTDYHNVTVFTKSDIDYINTNMVRIDFYARMTNTTYKPTANDIRIWNMLVNSMTVLDGKIMDAATKNDLKSKVSASIFERLKAVDMINRSLNYQFTSKYNNHTYLEGNESPGIAIFNQFLMSNDLTVDKVLQMQPDQVLSLDQQFQTYSSQNYKFSINNGKIEITGEMPTSQAYRDDVEEYALPAFKNLPTRYHQSNMFTSDTGELTPLHVEAISAADNHIIIKNLISKDIDGVEAAYLSIDDIIKNPNKYLSEQLQTEILDVYGVVNPETTVMYLKFAVQMDGPIFEGTSIKPDDKGNVMMTITLDQQGSYQFVAFGAAADIVGDATNFAPKTADGKDAIALADSNPDTQIIINNDSVIKSNAWKRWAKDLKIILDTSTTIKMQGGLIEEGRYNPYNNEIVLNYELLKQSAHKKNMNVSAIIYNVFCHEFTHAALRRLNFSEGASLFALASSIKKLGRVTPEIMQLLKDFNKHFLISKVPLEDLSTQDLQLAAQLVELLVYYNSNESLAFSAPYRNNSPFAFIVRNGRRLLLTSWGAEYDVTSFSKVVSAQVVNDGDSNFILPDGVTEADIDTSYDLPKEFKGRYVSNKEALKSNLKYYIRHNEPIILDEELQYFIVNASKKNVPIGLWRLIYDGTLRTKWQAYRYFSKNLEEMSDETFELFNKSFFHNSHIKTKKDLQKLITIVPAAAGLVHMMRKNEAFETFITTNYTPDQLVEAIRTLSNDPRYAEAIKKGVEYSLKYNTMSIDIADADYISSMMEDFDGTLYSLAKVSNTVRKGVAKRTLHNRNLSTSTEIGGKKGDDKTMTLEEKLTANDIEYTPGKQSKNPTELVEELVDEDYTFQEKEKFVTEWYYANYIAPALKKQVTQHGDKFDSKQQAAFIRRMFNKIYDKGPQWIENAFANLHEGLLVNENGRTVKIRDIDDLTKRRERPRKNVIIHSKALVTSIWNNVSKKNWSKLPEDVRNMIDENGKLKQEYFVDKSNEEISKTEARLLEVNREVKVGLYQRSSKTIEKYRNEVEKLKQRNEELRKKLQKERVKESKKKKVVIKVDNARDVVITSGRDFPEKLVNLLNTACGTRDKTMVQLFSAPDETHLRLSMKDFITTNADALSKLNDADVHEIIAFYKDLVIASSLETDIRRFEAYSAYILAYIQRQHDLGVFQLTLDEIGIVAAVLKKYGQDSGTGLAIIKNVVNYLKPEELIAKEISRSLGIEISDEDIAQMTDAILHDDLDKLKRIEQRIYQSLLQSKGKRSILERLSTFHRAMMLSNIGTAVRNKISNYTLYWGNKLADIFGKVTNVLPGKLGKKHKGQYDFTGIRMPAKGMRDSDPVWQYIQKHFVDNGLIDMLEGGLSRYDDYASRKSTSTDEILIRMIRDNLEGRLLYDRNVVSDKHKAGQIVNNLVKLVFKMQSDDKIIRKTALEYFYKIIVSEKISISNDSLLSMKGPVMEAFADAYAQASFDYMRKPTVFSRLENQMRKLNESAYYIYKLMFPFMSAGWNWFNESLNWTPVGIVKGVVNLLRFEKTVNKIDKMRAKGIVMPSSRWVQMIAKRNIGKGLIGTGLLTIGMILGAIGVIDWDDEDNKMVLKINSLKVDLSAITGTSALFIGATLVSKLGKDEYNLLESLKAASNVALDQFFLTDFINTVKYSSGDTTGVLSRMGQNIINGFVPNFLRAVGNVFTFTKTDYASGWLGMWQRFLTGWVPGLANVFSEVDIYTGEPAMKPWYDIFLRALDQFTPFDVTADYFSDAELEAISVGVKQSQMLGTMTINGEKYEFDQKILNEKYGELNKASLEQLYNNRIKVRVKNEDGTYSNLTYANMTTDQKKRAIENLMSKNSTYAKIYYWTQVEGHRYYATNSEYNELRKLKIIKNVYKETKKLEGFVK